MWIAVSFVFMYRYVLSAYIPRKYRGLCTKKLARGDNVLKSCRRHISLLSVAPRIKMFIGDGAKLVRDAFELAKEKCKDQHKVRFWNSFECSTSLASFFESRKPQSLPSRFAVHVGCFCGVSSPSLV